MARMIPTSINPENVPSPGEREIFRRLRDDPETADWVVLHSLDIAHHRKQVTGEVDFVVIVPQKGVLCVEVKAHRQVSRHNGLWFYGTNPAPDPRGPFKQVAESMHSLRTHIRQRQPNLSHIVFWSAVIFPYVEFSVESEEWHRWQVIDARLFRSYPLGRSLVNILNQARRFLQEQQTTLWFDPRSTEPSAKQCGAIADVLRPNFEFFESPKARAQRLEEELKHYTAEQLVALDSMDGNPRVIFEGPAGTGKTMLAIEAARRGRLAGRKILFVCFNHHLGRWLEDQTQALQPEVKTRTLHSHMINLTGIQPTDGDDLYWRNELPNCAIDALLESGSEEHVFDELIVDEAQDILLDTYLDFLDLSVKGGLATGRWRFFGDFEKQAIYTSGENLLQRFREMRAPLAPMYSLRANCRNTPRVADLVLLLGGLEPGYSRILRPDDRVNPELLYYTSDDDQKRLLVDTLQSLMDAGYSGKDIVILSTRGTINCISSQIDTDPWTSRLQPFGKIVGGNICFCSIPAFKGLEAPVVIVTDIDQIDDRNRSRSLFYIAATRCLQRLIIFMHTRVQDDILRILGATN